LIDDFGTKLKKIRAKIEHWYFNQVQEERQVLFPTAEELELMKEKRIAAHEKMLKLAQENPLNNRIIGSIYGRPFTPNFSGNALGDAVGLATEFLDAKTSQVLYGSISDNSLIPFPNFHLNRHNQHWARGDWSDDTDQLILILQTILETGKVDPLIFGMIFLYSHPSSKKTRSLGRRRLSRTQGRIRRRSRSPCKHSRPTRNISQKSFRSSTSRLRTIRKSSCSKWCCDENFNSWMLGIFRLEQSRTKHKRNMPSNARR
jgi:hypothetical protein